MTAARRLLCATCILAWMTSGGAMSHLLAAPADHAAQSMDDGAAAAREQLGFTLGVEAYIYGSPLVIMEKTRMTLTTPGKSPHWAPVNQLLHATKLLTHENRAVVAPNADTIYTSTFLDLKNGPMVIHFPDTAGRFYVAQFMDAYTNTFKNLGRRTTGTKAGDYLFTGPGWQGVVPTGMTRIESPTNTVWMIARFLVDGPADLPNVKALQDQMTLTPAEPTASANQPASEAPANPTDAAGNAAPVDKLAFFKALGGLLRREPPPPGDAVLLHQFETIGLSAKDGFHVPDDATAAGLARAIPAADQLIEALCKKRGVVADNGWRWNPQLGTYGDDFLLRAMTAKWGLGALTPEEAVYLSNNIDDQGKPLVGESKYVIHFDAGKLPPVNAFWSITLYGPDRFFVDNSIHRYAIGDRTAGLTRNADGSLDIYVQRECPPGKEGNWLPSPAGEFDLVVRAYQPRPEILNSTYKVPPVRRVP